MISNCTRENDFISRLKISCRNIHAIWNNPQSSSVDKNLVAVSFVHNFCISGHDSNTGIFRSFFHGQNDAVQVFHWKSLFKDEGSADVKGICSTHTYIIHSAVNGKFSDISTREEDWIYDETVCGKCQFFPG